MVGSKDSATAGAAFFDLDRTLLTGASGPFISEALRHVGLLLGRHDALESLVFRCSTSSVRPGRRCC